MRITHGLCVIAAVATGAGIASAGVADVNIGDAIRFFDGPGSSDGGEFIAAKLPNENVQLFRTFCVQHGEYLDFNAEGFVVRGVSDHSTRDMQSGPHQADQMLAPETAYLYSHFRAGTLAGFDYGAGEIASGTLLQEAIWFYQNQLGGVNNVFAQLAHQAVLDGDWAGIGNVRIANLDWRTTRYGGAYHSAAGNDAQDVLVLIPLPSAGGLAIAGLGGLALRRRKR